MTYTKLQSKVTTIILTLLGLITITFGFYFVGFGFDVNDEAYQTMNAMNPTINPQAILASSISHLYGNVFGFSLYSMRVLNFCMNLLSIGAAVLYYYSNKKKLNTAISLFIALVWISLCIPVKSRLIGWDSYAIFFTTLSLITMVELWKRNVLSKILLLGFLTACATLARFPDIVIVPIALISILYSADKGSRWQCVLYYLAAYMLSIIVILAIIYHGNIAQWIYDLKANFVSGHNINRLIGAYIHTGTFDLIDIVLLSVFLMVGKKCVINRKYTTLFVTFLFIILCALMFSKLGRVHYPVNRFLTASIIVFACIYVVYAERKTRIRHLIAAIVIVGCCLVPMAGSDGGTIKFMNISTIPVILSLLPVTDIKKAWVTYKSYQTMLWVVLAACALMMPFYTAKHSVFDGGWYNARAEVHHRLLNNNTTTQERADVLNDMLCDGEKILPDKCLIVGDNNRRFFSEYIWGCRNSLWPHDWSENIFNDDSKVELLVAKIHTGEIDDIVFVKYGANDKANFEINKMRSAILATGQYSCQDYKWFVVCTKLPKE